MNNINNDIPAMWKVMQDWNRITGDKYYRLLAVYPKEDPSPQVKPYVRLSSKIQYVEIYVRHAVFYTKSGNKYTVLLMDEIIDNGIAVACANDVGGMMDAACVVKSIPVEEINVASTNA